MFSDIDLHLSAYCMHIISIDTTTPITIIDFHILSLRFSYRRCIYVWTHRLLSYSRNAFLKLIFIGSLGFRFLHEAYTHTNRTILLCTWPTNITKREKACDGNLYSNNHWVGFKSKPQHWIYLLLILTYLRKFLCCKTPCNLVAESSTATGIPSSSKPHLKYNTHIHTHIHIQRD